MGPDPGWRVLAVGLVVWGVLLGGLHLLLEVSLVLGVLTMALMGLLNSRVGILRWVLTGARRWSS